MSILIALGVISTLAVIAAVRCVVSDGYRRSPFRTPAELESTWSWR